MQFRGKRNYALLIGIFSITTVPFLYGSALGDPLPSSFYPTDGRSSAVFGNDRGDEGKSKSSSMLTGPEIGPGATIRLSVSGNGVKGDNHSSFPSISADGRYVAFTSRARSLVVPNIGSEFDVYVRDWKKRTTEMVSVNSQGHQVLGASFLPAISANGRYVTFTSTASQLVPGDTNGVSDIFVHDRVSGRTERVSVSSGGEQGNDWSRVSTMSADGRYVVFVSLASNLVPGDNNGVDDVFVHDRRTGRTERVSVSSAGGEGNDWSGIDIAAPQAITTDGRYVAFLSSASNLVSGDNNGDQDVFLRDREAGNTELITTGIDGGSGNGPSYDASLSEDGRYVAISSYADNLVPEDVNDVQDVFVFDRKANTRELVSVTSEGRQGDRLSERPRISADGRYVAFTSTARNLSFPCPWPRFWWLCPRRSFVRDRVHHETILVGISSAGEQGDEGSELTTISENGRYVAFASTSSNLVDNSNSPTHEPKFIGQIYLHVMK